MDPGTSVRLMDASNSSPESRQRWWLPTLVAVAILCLALPPLFRLGVEPDIAWLLHVAAAVLDGARYGVDVVEVNPPLIVWLSMLPVGFGRALGIDPRPLFFALAILMMAASVAWAVRLAGAHPVLRRARVRPWVGVACLALLALPPGMAFGQREHLALCLVLPYVLLAGVPPGARPVSNLEACLVGLLAGLGFGLKPFFVLPFAAVELAAWQIGHRRLRPETGTVVGFGLLYLAVAVALHPDWPAAMLALGPIYREYLVPTVAQFLQGAIVSAMALAVLLAAWPLLAPSRAPAGRWSTPVAAAAVGFALSAIAQWKSWYYLFVPVLALTTLALLLLALECRASRPAPRVGRWLVAGLVGLLLVARVHEGSHWLGVALRDTGETSDLAPRVQEVTAGRPILVLSTNHMDGFPLALDVGTGWASRYPSLWPLLVPHRSELSPASTPITAPVEPSDEREQHFLAQLADDIAEWQPGALVVLRPVPDSWGRGFSLRFDYLSLLRADPELRRLLSVYVPVDSTEAYLILGRARAHPGQSSTPERQ